MVAIIDYDAGNIKSVEKACAYLGFDTVLTRDERTILSADRVILPGVGAFGDAMQRLSSYGLVSVIRKVKEERVPLLGICLGLQLLFDGSEESSGVEGLGLLAGDICRIPDMTQEKDGARQLRVPHMGWNDLSIKNGTRLFDGISNHSYVYFVHSYYLRAKDRGVVAATTEYGVSIDAAVEADRVFACQFHPEKSGGIGLKILENYLRADF